MTDCTQDSPSRFRRWRVPAVAAALAMLCACGPYLADEGWRKSGPGLTDGTPRAGAAASLAQAGPAYGGGVVDAALISTDASGACTISRLAQDGGDPSDAELNAAFACVSAGMAPTYAASRHVLVRDFAGWTRVTTVPFFSEALGDRYGVVFANGRSLGLEGSDEHFDRGFPVGATLAVPTVTISDEGNVEAGPLVLVEKMEAGFLALQGNWRFTIVDTSGRPVAVTRGLNQEDVTVCADCTHSQTDLLYAFLLNDGVVPFADGAGPAFPSVDTFGQVPAQPSDGTGAPVGEGAILDPNAPILDPNAPITD